MGTPIDHGKLYIWVYIITIFPAWLVLQHYSVITAETYLINRVFLTLISSVIPALVFTALVSVVRTYVFKK